MIYCSEKSYTVCVFGVCVCNCGVCVCVCLCVVCVCVCVCVCDLETRKMDGLFSI